MYRDSCKHNVSSIAFKGASRGVIEDKTPILEKERGFLFWDDKPASWEKQDLTVKFYMGRKKSMIYTLYLPSGARNPQMFYEMNNLSGCYTGLHNNQRTKG